MPAGRTSRSPTSASCPKSRTPPASGCRSKNLQKSSAPIKRRESIRPSTPPVRNSSPTPNECRQQKNAAREIPLGGNLMPIERIEPAARMSRVVIHGDTVYLAGLTANKTVKEGLAEQTREILSLIDELLAKA